MKWEELNLEERSWSLPQTRAKNRNAHVIPLVQSAVDILRQLPSSEGFVFSTTGQTPVSGFSKAKAPLDGMIHGEAGEAMPH